MIGRSSKTVSRLDQMLTDAINGHFVESAYDETELSRLESRFRQYLVSKETAVGKIDAERMAIKGLVTDISHQTKTPLANVLLYTQLLEEQCSDESVAPYIRQIRIHAEKLEFLIQALIKISRLESGMVELHPHETPVAPLLEQALAQAKGRAEAKNIEIELVFDEKPEENVSPEEAAGSIRAFYDLRWTVEALGNLLDNAVKYSPAESRITVKVRVFEMFVCISVADEGPGIAEEEQAQIFERFYRGRNALGEEGSGVGLYLTRMILQKEQGYIKVASGKERGSCFSMYLIKDGRL